MGEICSRICKNIRHNLAGIKSYQKVNDSRQQLASCKKGNIKQIFALKGQYIEAVISYIQLVSYKMLDMVLRHLSELIIANNNRYVNEYVLM